MTDSTSSTNEQLAIIREHLTYLRTEVDKNTELLRSAIRYLLLGIAGIVALREKLDLPSLQELIPFAPIIVMALVAFFMTPTAFIVRTGRWMAYEERILNQIAGKQLLRYEEVLFEQRRARFHGHRRQYIFSILAISIFYWSVEIYFLYSVAPRPSNQVIIFYSGLAAIPWLISLNYMRSLLRVFREPLENIPRS
jgi:hypothetical protein